MLSKIIDTKIREAIKTKSKELNVLRAVKTAFNYFEIHSGRSGTENVIQELHYVGIIRNMIKERIKVIPTYISGQRYDLAEKETYEIAVLTGFLPDVIPDEEIDLKINQVIKEVNATSIKDMRAVIKRSQEIFQGAVDNEIIANKAKELLTC